MADPTEEELRALGVEDDEGALAALGVTDEAPAPPIAAPPFEGATAAGDGAIAAGDARGAVATALQGGMFNLADEVAGNDAIWRTIRENASKPRGERIDPMWAYRNARDKFRTVEEGFREENPKTALALGVGGALAVPNPSGMLGSLGYRLPKALWGVVGPGARGLASYLPSAVEGAVAGMGGADEAENMGLGAAIGAPLGVAGRVVGELGGAAIGGVRRLVDGIVRPSPFAQFLRSRGVEDLTIGQMAPDSFPAQMEEASTSVAGIGPSIKQQRDVGLQQWQQAMMGEVLPPGMSTPPEADLLGTQLKAIRAGFGPAYDAVKGIPIDPADVQKALWAADDPLIRADDRTRQSVAKWLENQMTALRLSPDGVSSDDVLALRSVVREEARGETDRAARLLYEKAEEYLSEALEKNLPPKTAAALRATDKQYAKMKTVSEAIGYARDQPTGVTPAQLSAAVAATTPDEAYQQGAGGALRSLADAGGRTVGAKIPMTGMRLLSAGPVPYVTGPLSYMANLPGPKAFLTGQTAAQKSLASNPVFQGATGAAMREGLGRAGQAGARTMEALRGAGAVQPSEGDLAEMLALQNPEALGPYAERLQRASAEGNLALVHWGLQQTDPQYRQLLAEARKAAQ